MLTAVQQDIRTLRYANDTLRNDKQFVRPLLRENGRALADVGADLRADCEMVLAAVQQTGAALDDASDELRADREVVLAAVQQDGMALQYASADLRADREVVLSAVKQDGMALQYAGKALQQDEQFVAELADVCPLSIVWRCKPQVTLAETARRAMRSKEGLRLLVKQARVSILGEPAMMKGLLLSAVEQGCLEDVLQILIAKQKKGILNALRTVMAWYKIDVPIDALVGLSLEVLCNTISSALVGPCA